MAAAIPEIAIFQRLLDKNQCIFASMLARYKISAATLTFLGSGNGTSGTTAGRNRIWKTQDGDLQEMELVICQLLDDIETKFQRLDLHFRGPAFEWD